MHLILYAENGQQKVKVAEDPDLKRLAGVFSARHQHDILKDPNFLRYARRQSERYELPVSKGKLSIDHVE